MNLVNKVAIVTGAGRGIGRAIAITLAREGANVVVNEIESLVRQALAIQADVSDTKEVNRMV